ncbi:A mating type protein [Scleroderma citrinum]
MCTKSSSLVLITHIAASTSTQYPPVPMSRQISSRENILSQIIRTADEIRLISKCGTQRPPLPSSSLLNPPTPYPPVPFVDPPNLLPDLVKTGLELATAENLYQGFLKRISEFKQAVENNFCQMTSRLSDSKSTSGRAITSHIKEQLVNAYRIQYERAVESWARELLAFVSSHQDKLRCTRNMHLETTHDSKSRTSLFNQEYVPLLEHFFDENPFPSRADKAFLAKKSRMTYRQIHVWFQNRRNRTKKEGKTLRRKPMSDGATLPLDTLYRRMSRYIVSPKHAVATPQAWTPDEPVSPARQACDIFVRSAPPHAFPCPYPPSCSYNPFPINRSSFVFDRSQWIRLPLTSPASRTTPTDIDSLVELFSQLNVRDDSPSQLKRGRCDTFAATLAITVRPSCAPHPALISRPVSTPRYVPKKLFAIPAPPTRLDVFRTSNPQLQHTTLVPVSSAVNKKRKLAPLPRRTPISNDTYGIAMSTSFCSRSRSSSSQTSVDTTSESSGYSSTVTTPEPSLDDTCTDFIPYLVSDLSSAGVSREHSVDLGTTSL